jgi:hypothetical protein
MPSSSANAWASQYFGKLSAWDGLEIRPSILLRMLKAFLIFNDFQNAKKILDFKICCFFRV